MMLQFRGHVQIRCSAFSLPLPLPSPMTAVSGRPKAQKNEKLSRNDNICMV